MEKIQQWLVQLFIKAIESPSNEQDRLEIAAWLVLVRAVLEEEISNFEKIKKVYHLVDTKKSIAIIFNSVSVAFKNYKDANLPLPIKIAIPVALTAAAIVGGQGLGIAAIGGAIGLPVILVVFVGVAGLTAIIESVIKEPGSRKYIGFVLVFILHDEILRRQRKDLRDAMGASVIDPLKVILSDDDEQLARELTTMDPLLFERHVMSFFKTAGMVAWVTKASNDFGVDGFARHPKGIIVVQCKRYESNAVGPDVVREFKGALEEHPDCVLGYVVTTSRFTDGARHSADKNGKIRLVDLTDLIEWHKNNPSFEI